MDFPFKARPEIVRQISPARRVQRGFTRLAFVVGFLMTLLVLMGGIFFSYDSATYPVRTWDAKACVKQAWLERRIKADSYNLNRADPTSAGCPYVTVTWDELPRFTEPRPSWLGQFLLWALASVAGAVAAGAACFAAIWAGGWVLSGFFKD